MDESFVFEQTLLENFPRHIVFRCYELYDYGVLDEFIQSVELLYDRDSSIAHALLRCLTLFFEQCLPLILVQCLPPYLILLNIALPAPCLC